MSDQAPIVNPANPFSPRAVLALVLFGAAVFVALLWMIGAGMTGGSTNDGGGHAGGKGLNGYAALAGLLEKRGHVVRRTRSENAFGERSLLVLTPPHSAKAEDIGNAIQKHRYRGPTLIVVPKWTASRATTGKNARAGWVTLNGMSKPVWGGSVPQLGTLDLRGVEEGQRAAEWNGLGRSGVLPDARTVSISSGRIVPLVRDQHRRVLAGYVGDDGYYPVLARAAGIDPDRGGDDDDIFPIVVVAEPDLLNNYGLADQGRAMLALALVEAVAGDSKSPIAFDLTLNGHGRTANLLTLAFTPPFLAATLCLLMVALAIAWRAFQRFGPPRVSGRAIAFGKRALVTNTAGLIRRSRRLHLVAEPYADRARERLARALALSRGADAAATEAAIDRALASRKSDAPPFSGLAARLRSARRPHDVLKAAQDLHALERILIR